MHIELTEERHIGQWKGHISKSEGASRTVTPVWYDSPEGEMMTIPAMQEGMTAFLITGDGSRNKLQTMSGGGYATVRIKLPRNWDSLMEKLGYRPPVGFQ